MKNLVRRGVVSGAIGLLACGPLIGLDDLRPRLTGDNSEAGTPDALVEAAVACRSNAECNVEGATAGALCVEQRCVKIDQEVCLGTVQPNMDVLKDDNVILVAAFTPIDRAGGAALNAPIPLTYLMALDEIKQVPNGTSGAPRPLALLFCESDPVTGKPERAVAHVTRELHVPAIIANFEGADLARYLTGDVKATKTFVLNPNPTTVLAKYANVDRLVWNLLGVPDDVATAYAPLVARAENAAATPDPLTVALVVSEGSALEESLATTIEQGPLEPQPTGGPQRNAARALRFNDAGVVENGPHYERITLQRDGDGFKIVEAVTRLRERDPDIVIVLTAADQEEARKLVENYTERAIADLAAPDAGPDALDAAVANQRHPLWILGPRNAESVKPAIQQNNLEDVEKRFSGIQFAGPDPNSPPKGDWALRVDNFLERRSASNFAAQVKNAENHYDALYWIAFGLAAAGPDAPINGESIRSGVRNLLSGPPVTPGDEDFVAAQWPSIGFSKRTFVGMLGPPNIEEQFGTWNVVGATYCYEKAPQEPRPVSITYNKSVYSYDADSGVGSIGINFCGGGFGL